MVGRLAAIMFHHKVVIITIVMAAVLLAPAKASSIAGGIGHNSHEPAIYETKCMVRVIQDHCSQTFSTYLGGWEGRSPVRKGCGAQPRELFFDDFLSILGKFSWSSKTELFFALFRFYKAETSHA